ncbi:MAG: hypothetical protein WD397_01260 [Wenzhouxiangellaceae bacterium]
MTLTSFWGPMTIGNQSSISKILAGGLLGLALAACSSTPDDSMEADEAADEQAAADDEARAEAERRAAAEAAARAEAERMAAERAEAAAAELPSFPWPPPKASTVMNLNDSALRMSGHSTTLGQLDEQLGQALSGAGYVERSYFSVPDGFALVTRLEQIGPDGTPLDPPDRWSADAGPVRQFDLRTVLRALFTANPGYFRILVFVVSPHPFNQSKEMVRREEAMEWLQEGMNRLPSAVARGRYTSIFRTTVLVYEFEKSEFSDPLLISGRLTARTHLQRSGLLPSIESNAEE